MQPDNEQKRVDVYLFGAIYQGIDTSKEEWLYIEGMRPDCHCDDCYFVWAYLKSLPHYIVAATHSFKDGQQVVEGRDYEFGYQMKTVNGWAFCTKQKYEDYSTFGETRIVAIPIRERGIIRSPSPGQQGEAERKEYILCAAIWYKEQPTPRIQLANVDAGLVLCGHRHGHIIHQFVALTGKRSVETECGKYVQGFLTNKERFVDRKEAMNISKESGQVTKSQSFEELFSEDLY